MFTLQIVNGTFLAEYSNGTHWFAWRFTRANVTGMLREIAWQAAQKDSPLDFLAAAGVMKTIREVTQ